tara:strand:+ start:1279 stop:4410 length:3132 start_codon:yes stop_codon:yes gene_type:complete
MTISLGKSLKIRSTIQVAAEPISFFWPMRTFIHHNPLHGLEHLPFDLAVKEGKRLFHGEVYLPRATYQKYAKEGKIDVGSLKLEISRFLKDKNEIPNIDLQKWLENLVFQISHPISGKNELADTSDIHAALHKTEAERPLKSLMQSVSETLKNNLLKDKPVYEATDILFGARVGDELDKLVIDSCLDFFDEGQSVWSMPERQLGFFHAWKDVASRNLPFFFRGVRIGKILEESETPEGIIAYVLEQLEVPEENWLEYFTSELVRLHGWVGFIRWRSSAKHYYWNQNFPGDLVDYLAIRMTLALALLYENSKCKGHCSRKKIADSIEKDPEEAYLRIELQQSKIIPEMAHEVDQAIARGNQKQIRSVFSSYINKKRLYEAGNFSKKLDHLASISGEAGALLDLSEKNLERLIDTIAVFEENEGLTWLRSMEDHSIKKLLNGINIGKVAPKEKRPFVQAMFCIDTRSERIRRNLETVGDYETYGIAGFFGVPVSFMELGKGSEIHLCPVILTPKNLVPEVSVSEIRDDAAVTALGKAMHELKESVLTPFVTVEAIGLLFGFDMIGKTVAPSKYNHWRKNLSPEKPQTRLLLDKLSREQADSILRAAQRAVILAAVAHELGLEPEEISDSTIRDLRELALNRDIDEESCRQGLKLSGKEMESFIKTLQAHYRINESFSHVQTERLSRIGFTLEEQVNYVGSALQAIGLVSNFSRFVLLVGHGSTSENNPYESALDCGACGGNHGVVSGRVLAQMANKPQVRRRLAEQGINIPDDTFFIPGFHNTTSDEIVLHDMDLVPSSHLMYVDRLNSGLTGAARLCATERMPTLEANISETIKPLLASKAAMRNTMDWSQVRPEWGLSRNAYFIIGRRELTYEMELDGRAFLHSYDYRIDQKGRLLSTIMTGPLVVGQWINMEHYFSAVDNQRFGSGSKVNHNVAGRFGVMSGNISDLRTGLPSQTVLKDGLPYHEPIRLITLIEAPFDLAKQVFESVAATKNLVKNAWIRMLIVDPETHDVSLFERGEWKHNYQLSSELLSKSKEVKTNERV